MRKLILSMQVSLDGFIEGPDNDMSWIGKDEEAQWADLFGMLKSIDLFILGREMFPAYSAFWKQALISPEASENQRKYATLAAHTKHIVFSKTMKDPAWENTQIIAGNVAEEIKKIKALPGKDIQIVGGAKLAATAIEANLVDEYRIVINPIILGSGKSFFREQHAQQKLEFVNVKKLNNGAVVVRYRRK